MDRPTKKIDVYLEVGKKRTFAGAIEWPGWCRSGRDEASALEALRDYGSRYARVLHAAQLEFQPPAETAAFSVVERLVGDATTDFGAPGKSPSSDARPVNDEELHQLQALLKACWQAFDEAARAAAGKELRKGPRGGGRELEGIVQHVLGADAGYLASLGGKIRKMESENPDEVLEGARQDMLAALESSAHGELPTQGPRGGARWAPRYYVRRAAWHVLDHTWEIEDRIV